MRSLFFSLLIISSAASYAQTNIISTTPLAEEVMKGNYDPAAYSTGATINANTLTTHVNSSVSADSLKSYIIQLASFRNRNTGADTLSTETGVGAARNWVYQKFTEYSAASGNRLIPSFLQFDQTICGMTRHKNIFAVLPGTQVADPSVVIIEGHMDSRCSGVCDTACVAEGVEDNASGTALVMELARVMSQQEFRQTIVFLVTIGEEQGLMGAEAFADYVQLKGIKVKAVQNNDVIGGIICGATSSAPSCPGLNQIDSTQVRLFSFGSWNSQNKQLSRYIKLQYKEQLLPVVKVPMTISIMSAEDRTGRGGDHIPFRQHGYPAMRFTSANEHGDASNSAGYTDRQHTSTDGLGVDTDGDMVIDSFFVDFNYLARNAVINGVSASMLAIGPPKIDFTASKTGVNQVAVNLSPAVPMPAYRIGIRTNTHDWDTVLTVFDTTALIDVPPAAVHFFSVASVDSQGVESMFSKEISLDLTGMQQHNRGRNIELLANRPNPFDESTTISIFVNDQVPAGSAFVIITDQLGRLVQKIPVSLSAGINDVLFEHGFGAAGVLTYSLELDGKILMSRQMVFTP